MNPSLYNLFECVAHESPKNSAQIRALYLSYSDGRVSRRHMNSQLRHFATRYELALAVKAFAAAVQKYQTRPAISRQTVKPRE